MEASLSSVKSLIFTVVRSIFYADEKYSFVTMVKSVFSLLAQITTSPGGSVVNLELVRKVSLSTLVM
jgi:hypothetical protein